MAVFDNGKVGGASHRAIGGNTLAGHSKRLGRLLDPTN
jgi:hypothetical protein